MSNPLCPFCFKPMEVRKNRKTGNSFYGCSQYPNCTGTRFIEDYNPFVVVKDDLFEGDIFPDLGDK